MAQFKSDTSQQWRMLKDRMVRVGVMLGGISVIVAIVLIFFYLIVVVWPLFESPDSELVASYQMPGQHAATSQTLHLTLDERGDIGGRITSTGEVTFFHTNDGAVINQQQLLGSATITAVAVGRLGEGVIALGTADGRALLVKTRYVVSYPNDLRTVTPELVYPYGAEPLEIDYAGYAIKQLAFRDSEEMLTLVASTEAGLRIVQLSKESSMLDDEISLEREQAEYRSALNVAFIRLDPDQKHLYLADSAGAVEHLSIADLDGIIKLESLKLFAGAERLTSFDFLLGGISLIVGSDQGQVSQWFPVRDREGNAALKNVRSFESDTAAITALAMESRRKGFMSGDSRGNITIFLSTAHRTVMSMQVSSSPITQIVSSPRSDFIFAEDAQGIGHFWHIANDHPEISWSALWGEVQYEGYDDKRYIWQSSSASNDFEPKFSLMPLAFGTLKAAFYAMLFAVPLAILGAIYTAYFMAPSMRQVVKPTIEIMEALPTVILGFLAGLWLAPLIESHLPGVFTMLLILPLGIVVTSLLWWNLPAAIRHRVPDGWEAVILIPVIIGLVWLSFALSLPMEQALFGGDMRSWMYNEFGIGYDQRNSLVIGLAMGFAVIPTIFSITEDAIFSVPKHLTLGSLALGATPWQTLTRVVILTASPGIFSAIMIGLGRAVGETMIVLMATGNTPVMDFSVFEGMRTLAANIAVEMPESEVDSSHYRILFLAALVLLSFTFVVNTLAEIVRHRLRKKYSSL
jgi:phosphate transport system permease protein